MKKTIACLGSGKGLETSSGYKQMVEVGRILAKNGCTVITGGYGGPGMEAPCRGAKEAGGAAIGVLMLGQPGNKYITDTIDCQEGLNFSAEIQFGLRLGNLLSASGFVISFEAGIGTFAELLAIMNLNAKWHQKEPKPVSIVCSDKESVDFWSNTIDFFCSVAGLSWEEISYIKITESTEEAVEWVVNNAVIIS